MPHRRMHGRPLDVFAEYPAEWGGNAQATVLAVKYSSVQAIVTAFRSEIGVCTVDPAKWTLTE